MYECQQCVDDGKIAPDCQVCKGGYAIDPKTGIDECKPGIVCGNSTTGNSYFLHCI